MEKAIELDDFFDEELVLNQTKFEKWKMNFNRRKWSLLFILPALIYIIIFCYIPMYGILVAFQDYVPGDKIIGSTTQWVGFSNFQTFFSLS